MGRSLSSTSERRSPSRTPERPAPGWLNASESPLDVDTFTEQGLANTMWAFATARHAEPALFDAVAKEPPRRMFNGEF